MFARKPDYLLKVRGMSMRDAGIMDGDLLAVQKAKEAKNGQIVVARLGDEVTVKRFKRGRHGIELIPENPDFETIVVSPEETQFEIEGLAVGLDPQQHDDVRWRTSAQRWSTRRWRASSSPRPRTPAPATTLEQLPNIGPALAADLRLIGIRTPARSARARPLRAVPAVVRGHRPAARIRACSTPSWPPPISCAAPRPRPGGPTRRSARRCTAACDAWRHVAARRRVALFDRRCSAGLTDPRDNRPCRSRRRRGAAAHRPW